MKTTNIPQTERQLPVVNPMFDPYRSVFVAPDHLLAGIAINGMTLAFKALPNVRRRKQADSITCQLLRSNGLQQESKVFNVKDKVMYTASISSTFCRLLVSAPAFKELVDDISWPAEMCKEEWDFLHEVIDNLCLFRKLVGRTYRYTRRDVDDPRSISDFNLQNGVSHITSLQDMCIKYMSKCNEICKRSTLAATELDKPNLHRLLELYHHSIPTAGHVQHFAELVFECAHQPLKRAMAKSNFRDSHLQSIKHSIADDWKARVAAAYATLEDCSGTGDVTDSLLNALCGRQEAVMREVKEDPALQKTMTNLLHNDIIKAIVGRVTPHLDPSSPRPIWYLTEEIDTDSDSEETPDKEHLSKIAELIRNYVLDVADQYPKFYNKARRVKTWGSGSSARTSHPQAHETLSADMVVQALVSDLSPVVLEPFERKENLDEALPFVCYFAIECFAYVSEGLSYAAVRKCSVTDNGNLMIDLNSKPQLVKMADAVRRTGLVHACSNDATLKCLQGSSSTCRGSILNGNLFHYFSREDGYPPRLA